MDEGSLIWLDVLNFLFQPGNKVELPPILEDEYADAINRGDFQDLEIEHFHPAQILEIMFLENLIINIYNTSSNYEQVQLIERYWLSYFGQSFKDLDPAPKQMLSGWISDAIVRDHRELNNTPPDWTVNGLDATNDFIFELVTSGEYCDGDIIDVINSKMVEHFGESANQLSGDSDRMYEFLSEIYDDTVVLSRCIWKHFPDAFQFQVDTETGVQVLGELIIEIFSIGEFITDEDMLMTHPMLLVKNQIASCRELINNYL